MPSETNVALKAISGRMGWDWKSPAGAMLRAGFRKHIFDTFPKGHHAAMEWTAVPDLEEVVILSWRGWW